MHIGDRQWTMRNLVLFVLSCIATAPRASVIVRRAGVASNGVIDLLPPVEPQTRTSGNGSSLVLNKVDACVRRSDECPKSAHSEAKRMAVYTYVTGAYEEIRDFNVPCVPDGVDAFFMLDDVTRKSASAEKLELWRRRGWWILTMMPTMTGTSEVPVARFAAKTLKFTPPSWLLNGTWDWLIEFDGDISLDMAALRPLVDKYSDKSLVLLKWYWKDCQPWDCFMWECDDMLQNRKEYVQTSYDRVVKWKEQMQKLHDDTKHPFVPADYYELSVMFRNVAHARAGEVEDTFRQVLDQCRTIQRDQFLMPFFLWNASLEQDVAVLPIATLYSDLQYCRVETRKARNLLANQNVGAKTGDGQDDASGAGPDELFQEIDLEPPLTS